MKWRVVCSNVVDPWCRFQSRRKAETRPAAEKDRCPRCGDHVQAFPIVPR